MKMRVNKEMKGIKRMMSKESLANNQREVLKAPTIQKEQEQSQ